MTLQRMARKLGVAAAVVVMAACLLPGKKPPAAPPPGPTIVKVEEPPKIPINLTLQATPTINLSESNRPSPVVVRVYQLKDDAAFRAATYEKLFDEDVTLLEKDLIQRTPFTVRPGEQTTVSVPFSQGIRFIGIAAFFRQYDGKQWRVVIPALFKGDFIISVDQSSVSFAAK
jgi:type VI secretion system protein VasD